MPLSPALFALVVQAQTFAPCATPLPLPGTALSGPLSPVEPAFELAPLDLPEPLALPRLERSLPSAPEPSTVAPPDPDRLFRGDARWLGSDGAYSVALGGGRTLWLFGDTFVEPSGTGGRRESAFVRNTIGIQTGASMAFHWGERDGRPADSFGTAGGEWLWPSHGRRVGGKLLLFFLRIRGKGAGVFDFETVGWTARVVENPDEAPSRWVVRDVSAPEGSGFAAVGAAGLWARDGHVYAMSPALDGSAMFLARWDAAAAAGDFSTLRWWDGRGWSLPSVSRPASMFAQPGMDGSLHVGSSGRWLWVHSRLDGSVAIRRAPQPEGPWSEPETLFTPPPADGVFYYAAKAHPDLGGVITYAANAWTSERLFEDPELYYPHFVRVPLD